MQKQFVCEDENLRLITPIKSLHFLQKPSFHDPNTTEND